MYHPNFLFVIGLSMATITATAQIIVPNHNPRGNQPDVPLEQNVFLGAYSGFNNTSGFYNVGIGNHALYFNTTGYSNTANGFSTLYSNTVGSNNTANGSNALYYNTTGNNNTANGSYALYSNTTGNSNTANGNNALYYNTTGNSNTANGYSTLHLNTTGGGNTANGYSALYSNTTGGSNTANGVYALYYNTTGYSNTANGNNALYYNTIGTYNTAIGWNAGPSTRANAINTTCIGYEAGSSTTLDNQVNIGNTSVTAIKGQVNWSTYSDGRIKNKVQENVPGLAFITKLRPVTYHLDIATQYEIANLGVKDTTNFQGKYDIEKMQMTGFIAQEVETAAKACSYDFSGVDIPVEGEGLYSLRYAEFVVPLVAAVKELAVENTDLKAVIAQQNADIAQQNTLIAQQNADIQAIKNTLAGLGIPLQPTNGNSIGGGNATVAPTENRLFQNIPNPLDKTTTIPYFIQENSQQAKITLVNTTTGQVVKEWNSLAKGNGTIAVDSALLAAGTYSYSLVVDGRLIATKQMVIAR